MNQYVPALLYFCCSLFPLSSFFIIFLLLIVCFHLSFPLFFEKYLLFSFHLLHSLFLSSFLVLLYLNILMFSTADGRGADGGDSRQECRKLAEAYLPSNVCLLLYSCLFPYAYAIYLLLTLPQCHYHPPEVFEHFADTCQRDVIDTHSLSPSLSLPLARGVQRYLQLTSLLGMILYLHSLPIAPNLSTSLPHLTSLLILFSLILFPALPSFSLLC